MARSRSRGCENEIWKPDCRLGSKLLKGLLVADRAVSYDTLHVPEPQGRRWRTPVDENQSSTSTPRWPSSSVDGGVALLDRPTDEDSCGTNALRLSPTRAAHNSVPRLTPARSGLLATARRTASSSVRRSVSRPASGDADAGACRCAATGPAASATRIAALAER